MSSGRRQALTLKLHLVRHAIAEEPDGTVEDAARRLTREGARRMRLAIAGLHEIGIELDLVLTSPLRRACETAALLDRGLGGVTIETIEALAPGGDPRAILRAIEKRNDLGSIALVGHEPDLGRFAARLLAPRRTGPPLPFKKGGVARFDWRSAGAPASLEWFLPPRILRRLARSG